MTGPLTGYRIVEMTAIGPVPFVGMLLADMGADVIRIERRQSIDIGLPGTREARFEVLHRGRPSVAIDLRTKKGRDAVLRLVSQSDALIEGFRPGAMERLGLGPAECQHINPRLIYGRMTGFGQTGPLAPRAGHDINYIALTGALHAIGRKDERPVPPISLLGDFGGGAMFLAFGIVAALLERQRSGAGQVIDTAMTGGTAYLMAAFYALRAAGEWCDERGSNTLDGGAPWYDTYATKDGKFVAVGAIEARFYKELLQKLDLDKSGLPDQHDRDGWPELRARLRERFLTRSRDEWEHHFEGSDACVMPVLTMEEAPAHAHNAARRSFLEREGVPQPAPHPIFQRTPGSAGELHLQSTDPRSVLVLKDWGFSKEEIQDLVAGEILGPAQQSE